MDPVKPYEGPDAPAWRVLGDAVLARSLGRLVAIIAVAGLLIAGVAQVPIATLVAWSGGADAAPHTVAGAARRSTALATPSSVPRVLVFGASHLREAITSPADLERRIASLSTTPIEPLVFAVSSFSPAQAAGMLAWADPGSGGLVVVFTSAYRLREDLVQGVQLRQRWPVAPDARAMLDSKEASWFWHPTLGNIMPCLQIVRYRTLEPISLMLGRGEREPLHVPVTAAMRAFGAVQVRRIDLSLFNDEFEPLVAAIARLRAGGRPWRVLVANGLRREKPSDATSELVAYDHVLAEWCRANDAVLWNGVASDLGLVPADFRDPVHIDNAAVREPFTAGLAARIAEELP